MTVDAGLGGKDAVGQLFLGHFQTEDRHRDLLLHGHTGGDVHEDWEYLALATEKLHDAPIYMDDTSGITITEMKAKIRRVNQDPTRPNVGLIVIDYLQLMTTGQRSENRVQEISSITRNLKIMAKEMNVPIIALSQLSRAVEKQGNNSSHRPQLSDLRDSGSIEQDADCVLFLYRDSYYASQNPDGAEVDADTAEGQQDAQQCHAVCPAGHCRCQMQLMQRGTRGQKCFLQTVFPNPGKDRFVFHQRLKSTSIKRVWAPSQPSGTVLVSP